MSPERGVGAASDDARPGSGTAARASQRDARITVQVGDWATLRQAAERVRRAVFVVEQHLPEAEEFDDADPRSVHAVAFDGPTPVATGRLLPDARIGRMAVLAPYRRSGVGARLLERLIGVAGARGDTELVLSSQAYVRAFYARHGFVAEGDLYDDSGIPHQTMRRRLR